MKWDNYHKLKDILSEHYSDCRKIEEEAGKDLISVKITDKALNTKMIEAEDEIYGGAIQFVDFNFSDGSVLQFAVYNSHNGYYGHDILIAKDNKILLEDVL